MNANISNSMLATMWLVAATQTSAFGQQDRGLAVTFRNWSKRSVTPVIVDSGTVIVKRITVKPNQAADYTNIPRGSVLRLPRDGQSALKYPIKDLSVRLTYTSQGFQPHERINNPSDGGQPTVTMSAVSAIAPTVGRHTVKVVNSTGVTATGQYRELQQRQGVVFLPGETGDFQIEPGKSYDAQVASNTSFNVKAGVTTYRFQSSGPGTWTIRNGQNPTFKSQTNDLARSYTVNFVNNTGFDVKGVSSSTGMIKHLTGPMEVAPQQTKKLDFGGTGMNGRPLNHQVEFAVAKSWSDKPEGRALIATPIGEAWNYRIVINEKGKIVVNAKGVKYNGKYINPTQVESAQIEASVEPAPQLGFASKATQRGGLTVTSVQPGSVADAMGLKVGQIIRMVNGFGVNSFEQLHHQLSLAKKGNGHLRMSVQKPNDIYFETMETWIKFPW